MSTIAEIFRENPLAVVFGLGGLFCQMTWSLFRTRSAILTAQFGIGANYSIQYAFLEAWSGAGVASLGAMQSAVALIAGNRPWLRFVGLAFLPAIAVVCYITWSGIETLCALAAVTLIIIGRSQTDVVRLRTFLLAAAPFGMGYDILTGAAPALMGGIISASLAATMLVRELKQRKAAMDYAAHAEAN